MQHYLPSNALILIILIFMPIVEGAHSIWYYRAFLEDFTVIGYIFSKKTNEPAAGAVVKVGYKSTDDDETKWNTVKETTVNADGSFKVEYAKLRPGGQGYLIAITYEEKLDVKTIFPDIKSRTVDIENYYIPDLSTTDKVVMRASNVASKSMDMLGCLGKPKA